MVTSLTPPSRDRAIVDSSGKMSQEFTAWTQSINGQSLIIGTGSPEGVIEAAQGREYMDSTGAAGSIKYIKRDADIAGDKTKGWILV